LTQPQRPLERFDKAAKVRLGLVMAGNIHALRYAFAPH
jgi:hypothetical protein